ncbi:MAG TPA: carbon-nitrogen hydrolase family protein [bacterium]|nr:carbon-nitrogen hydrolase family protein [bacterium]
MSAHPIQAAVIQMKSGADVASNLAWANGLLTQAARRGAQLAVLPENFACMTAHPEHLHAVAEDFGYGPIQEALARMARRHGLWLVGGTLPLRNDDSRLSNTCLVFDERGQLQRRYDKIHLFDVSVPGGETHQESANFAPGQEVIVINSPLGRLGLAVCYDLRFPELFRQMLAQGVEVIALPAAFTHATGQAHWDVLLRARAIENQCFVLAAAQGGEHFPGRQTYGHSQIIDPWGRTLGQHAYGWGLALAAFDREQQRTLRQRIPALSHRRLGV